MMSYIIYLASAMQICGDTEDEPEMRIGFIGLGVMGAPMARHLSAAGHQIVTTLNRSPLPDGLEVTVLASPADVARESEIVITMLPDTPDVERVLIGRNGVVEAISPGAIVID